MCNFLNGYIRALENPSNYSVKEEKMDRVADLKEKRKEKKEVVLDLREYPQG